MKRLSAKQKAENAILWIDRLSTSSSRQTTGELGNAKIGYCCLGYGCMVTKTEYDPSAGSSSTFSNKVGLISESGRLNGQGKYFEEIIEEKGISFIKSLIDLNDDANLSFRRISTQIKKNLKDLFEPKVSKILIKHYNN